MAENKTSFQTILDALLNDNKDFPQRYLQFFSDLDPASLKAFLDVWLRVNPTRKLILLRQLEVLAESNTIFDASYLWYLDENRLLIMLTSSDAWRAEKMIPNLARKMRSIRRPSGATQRPT